MPVVSNSNYIRVIALSPDAAKRYAMRVLGCDAMRILDVTDEGTPGWSQCGTRIYKAEARIYYVHVSGNADNVFADSGAV